ncbi:unnamed protein product [Arctia plantaginis]|uniref:Uncharacterized protein n=1 Tax=Arctia plantaginis TaxID=874455 RepID=A0A8S1AT56_ARCPL|nr:unnamed protein product [Arctia plantaginis]
MLIKTNRYYKPVPFSRAADEAKVAVQSALAEAALAAGQPTMGAPAAQHPPWGGRPQISASPSSPLSRVRTNPRPPASPPLRDRTTPARSATFTPHEHYTIIVERL